MNHIHPSPPASVTNPPPRQNNPFVERPEVALGDDNSYAPAGSNRRLRLRIAGDAAFSTFATFKKKNPDLKRREIRSRHVCFACGHLPPGAANHKRWNRRGNGVGVRRWRSALVAALSPLPSGKDD